MKSREPRDSATPLLDALAGVLAGPLREIAGSIASFDPSRVQTHLQGVDRVFERAIGQVHSRDLDWAAIASQLPQEMDMERQWTDSARELKASALASSSKYSLLLTLLKKADATLPCSPILALKDFNALEVLRRMCEPLDLLLEVEGQTGEVRARTALRALRETCEMVYEPFLRVVAVLGSLVQRQQPRTAISGFANLIAHASSLTAAWPGLVDARFTVWRNAASHAHWYYRADLDQIVLWDVNSPEQRVSVGDLVVATWDAYALAGPCYFFTAQLYICRDFMLANGLFRELADLMPSMASLALGAPGAFEEAALRWSSRIESLLAPLRAEVASWPARVEERSPASGPPSTPMPGSGSSQGPAHA